MLSSASDDDCNDDDVCTEPSPAAPAGSWASIACLSTGWSLFSTRNGHPHRCGPRVYTVPPDRLEANVKSLAFHDSAPFVGNSNNNERFDERAWPDSTKGRRYHDARSRREPIAALTNIPGVASSSPPPSSSSSFSRSPPGKKVVRGGRPPPLRYYVPQQYAPIGSKSRRRPPPL
jgi:hypothetical protein